MKLLGAIGVILFGAYLAVRGGRVYPEGLRQAEGFLHLLRFMRERIACFRTPTEEILSSFENAALARAGVLTATAEGGLAAALRESADRLYLDGEEMAVLCDFAAGLGTGFAEEEVLRCELAIRRMEEAVAARRDALPRSARLYRTLTVSAAVAVVIVLI